MIYFTSDLHVGHDNILKYCQRPFETVEEHDQALLNHWNATVSKTDTVYVLGDFCLHRNVESARKWVSQLNGGIYLLYGNHDKTDRYLIQDGLVFLNSFALGSHYNMNPTGKESKIRLLPADYVLKVPDADAPGGIQRIVLSHYAHRVWNGSHRGAWHLYGHSHGGLADDPEALSTDVGVDVWNYKPVSYDMIKRFMGNKKILQEQRR